MLGWRLISNKFFEVNHILLDDNYNHSIVRIDSCQYKGKVETRVC